MRYRIVIAIWAGLVIAAGLMAFEQTEVQDSVIRAMIREEVDRRVTEYRRVRMLKCRERIFKVADRKADSIVLALAREDFRIDTIPRPGIPERPERPEIRPPKDTTPVVPLLPVDSF